jgi:hypothetical protein
VAKVDRWLEFDPIADKPLKQEALETVKSVLQTLLASAMTLSAVHCVDPAIPERGVIVPEVEKTTPKTEAKPANGPKLEL